MMRPIRSISKSFCIRKDITRLMAVAVLRFLHFDRDAWFFIRKTKTEFATCVFDRHATWSLLLDRGWPKTLKDSTLNFLMPSLNNFWINQATITAAKLFTVSNCFWQLIIGIIFCCEILIQIIIRLVALFLWLIGEEYFGKRFWLKLLSDFF